MNVGMADSGATAPTDTPLRQIWTQDDGRELAERNGSPPYSRMPDANREPGNSLGEEDLSLTQTLTGRLRNFPLTPSPDNSLWGLYEAISNSLHAIRDRPTNIPRGRITIDVERDDDGVIDGFTIIDNGVGLDKENFKSFRKIDSNFKAKRGGKGVGRLTWLKIYNKVQIQSGFIADDGERHFRSFEFVEDDDAPIKLHKLLLTDKMSGTRVYLTGMKGEYLRECPKRPETLLRLIIRHFLKDLLSKDSLEIIVNDNGNNDLAEVFNNSIIRRAATEFSLMVGTVDHKFFVTHLVASKAFADHEVNENVIYLLAHGRVVARRPVSGLIGIKKLSGGRTYVGLVESSFLDVAVTQERTMLNFDSDLVDSIVRQAAETAEEFLDEDTQPVRDRQLIMIKQIKKEYPRLIGTLASENEFAQKLPLSVRDQESAFRAVSLEWYRSKRKSDRSIRAGLNTPKNDESFRKAVADASASIASESKAILADYLTERKVVIDFLARLVARVRSSTGNDYELEASVHDLIVPRKTSSATTKFETHNLWLLDERLPYYYYFNSDNPLSEQIEGSSDRRRPDIALYDIASSFEQRGSNEPFIIVELKRPGRDNYGARENPLKQCLDYVLAMREDTRVTSADGSWNSSVHNNTLFYCYIVADITPTLRRLMDLEDMKRTPDGRGYFKYHEGLRA